ncbi:hypothetical protein [Bradyrhizobium sp. USDA 4353]
MVNVSAGQEAEYANGVQAHQHANHQDEDEPQEGRRRRPMVSQPAAATRFPASSTTPMMMTGQKALAKIAVRQSMEKAADTQASASAGGNFVRTKAKE